MDDGRSTPPIDGRTARVTGEEALAMHAEGRPGKLEIRLTKPLVTARDLSLAYSPGVAEPCLHIHRDPKLAYDYTAKGNFVAVVSNGTAVLGLGNLGALASKPVMEGKVALFKRFADVDGMDLCVDTEDADEFVNAVKHGNKYDQNKLVRITADLSPKEARFTIEDEGEGFNVNQIPDPRDPSNLFKTSGRGVLLIYNIMDEVEYNDRGNRLTMVKRPDNSLEHDLIESLSPPDDDAAKQKR